jgi:hypothetical protein
MAELGEEKLRALIRLLPPVVALGRDLKLALHTETYQGTGDAAVRSFAGLQAAMAGATDDPYIQSLAITLDATAGDKEKVAAAGFAANQLVAYVEGQLGLGGVSTGGSSLIIEKGIVHSSDITIEGIGPEGLQKLLGGRLEEDE